MEPKCLNYQINNNLRAWGKYKKIKRYNPTYFRPYGLYIMCAILSILLLCVYLITKYIENVAVVIAFDIVLVVVITCHIIQMIHLYLTNMNERMSVLTTDKGLILISQGELITDIISLDYITDVRVHQPNQCFKMDYGALEIESVGHLKNIYLHGIPEFEELYQFITLGLDGANDINMYSEDEVIVDIPVIGLDDTGVIDINLIEKYRFD